MTVLLCVSGPVGETRWARSPCPGVETDSRIGRSGVGEIRCGVGWPPFGAGARSACRRRALAVRCACAAGEVEVGAVAGAATFGRQRAVAVLADELVQPRGVGGVEPLLMPPNRRHHRGGEGWVRAHEQVLFRPRQLTQRVYLRARQV